MIRRHLGRAKDRDSMKRFREETEQIRSRLMKGEYYDVIAEEYGVSVPTVYKYFPVTSLVNEIQAKQKEDE